MNFFIELELEIKIIAENQNHPFEFFFEFALSERLRFFFFNHFGSNPSKVASVFIDRLWGTKGLSGITDAIFYVNRKYQIQNKHSKQTFKNFKRHRNI